MRHVSQLGLLVMFVFAALLAASGHCSSERLHGGGITLSTRQLWKPTFFMIYIALLSNQVLPLSAQLLLPYGSMTSDGLMTGYDDDWTAELILSPPFPYFDTDAVSLYVHTNGYISFNDSTDEYEPEPFPLEYIMVAPFYADADPSECGYVWYRQTTDASVLGLVQTQIQNADPSYSGFIAAWAYVATWEAVCFKGAEGPGLNLTNTFQVAVVRDASSTNSFFIMNYEQLEWTTGIYSWGSNETGLGGDEAVAGANAGDEIHFFEIPGSFTPEVLNLTQTTNVGVPGRWICKISSATPDPPTLSSDAVVVTITSDVTLTCASPSCGVLSYTFLHNGAVISTGETNTHLVAAGGGAGDYTCIVTVDEHASSPPSNVITIVEHFCPPYGFYFADPTNMCRFYQCDAHGNHFHMTCGPRTKWDQSVLTCVHLGRFESCP